MWVFATYACRVRFLLTKAGKNCTTIQTELSIFKYCTIDLNGRVMHLLNPPVQKATKLEIAWLEPALCVFQAMEAQPEAKTSVFPMTKWFKRFPGVQSNKKSAYLSDIHCINPAGGREALKPLLPSAHPSRECGCGTTGWRQPGRGSAATWVGRTTSRE